MLLSNFNWKAFLRGPVFVILVAVGCFFAGRSTAPERLQVHTVDKIVEVHHKQTTIRQQIDIDALMKQVQDKSKTIERNVVREIITQKDGTKIERETDLSHVNTTVHKESLQETKTTVVADIQKLIDSYKAEDRTTLVTITKEPPKWRVGIMGGYSDVKWSIPSLPSGVLVGAFAERNIIGPINAGAWVTNAPGVGLQLSVSF